MQSADDIRVLMPQAGAGASWAAELRSFSAVVSGYASSLQLHTDEGSRSERQSTVAGGAGGALTARLPSGFFAQIEGNVARNEFRASGETISISSDLFTLGGTGTENRAHGRVSAGRQWQPLTINAYGDWLRQASASSAQVHPFRAESASYSLQVTTRLFTASLSVGDATVDQTVLQDVRYLSAAASTRIFRYARLNVMHRADVRRVIGEPDVDGARSEAGLSLRIGAFNVEPHAFIATRRTRSGMEQENRGLTISITREFGGLLPIVSGIARRGTVR
jgi:hypothetical protein